MLRSDFLLLYGYNNKPLKNWIKKQFWKGHGKYILCLCHRITKSPNFKEISFLSKRNQKMKMFILYKKEKHNINQNANTKK